MLSPDDTTVSLRPFAPGEPPPGGTLPIPGEVRPLPLPGGDGGSVPGSRPILNFVAGTEGDDRLTLEPGSVAFGAGGNDTFVLTSAGFDAGSERLGYITDFREGDKLDLSLLGGKAQVIGRQAGEAPYSPDRVSIDYDGDGDEDGHLFVSSGRPAVDPGVYRPMPMPDGGRPLPVEPDGGNGSSGEFRILPFPMPGDGPFPVPETRILLASDNEAGDPAHASVAYDVEFLPNFAAANFQFIDGWGGF